MTNPMGYKISVCACVLFASAALGACDADKSSDATRDVSVARDVAREDGKSAPKEAKAESETESKPSRPVASSPGVARVDAEPPLDVSGLLKKDDLGDLTSAEVEVSDLIGKSPTPTYNATRLHPADGDLYGVGLQVWELGSDSESVDFVGQMRAQYLGVEDAPKDAPTGNSRSFISSRSGIRIYVFAPEGEAGYAAAVSCGDEFCEQGWEDLKGLVEKVDARLGDKEEGSGR
jgi:hypothetical protein